MMLSPYTVLATLLLTTLHVSWLRVVKSTDTVATLGASTGTGESAKYSFDLDHYEQQLHLKITKSTMNNRKTSAGEAFKAAKPFPHAVSTDMFPEVWMREISLEIPDQQQSINANGCIGGGTCHSDNVHEKGRTVFSSPSSFGPATEALHRFMRTTPFIKYLQSATGIDDLVAGHEDADAGVYQTVQNGFEKVHSDFNMDKRRGLHRRVAVYLYLNPDWRHHYGGYLELWSRDLERCEARISPDLGTMVVFATTDFSFHGQQTPLACPANRSHRMLAEYYYTRGRPSDECLNDNCFLVHDERYQSTRCPACDGQCFEKK